MKNPTIYEIKAATKAKSPYFFSRDTMRFFGQKMKHFTVKKSPSDRVFIYAPAWESYQPGRRPVYMIPDTNIQGHFMHFTLREFKNGDLISPEGFKRQHYNDYKKALQEILDYIEEN